MSDNNAQQPTRHFVGVIAIEHGLLLLGDPLQIISTPLGAMGFEPFLQKHIDPVRPPHRWGPYRIQRTSKREDGVRALVSERSCFAAFTQLGAFIERSERCR